MAGKQGQEIWERIFGEGVTDMNQGFTRREFLGSAAAGAAGAATSSRRRLREFGYGDVRLTEGPIGAMYRRMQAHFLGLDEDRILKVYRQRAGLPAPGRDMGGWYDANGFVPGHLLGQFVSGLARIHSHTGLPEAAAKAGRLVRGYAATMARDGVPYASPKAETWACYILDKYEIGLIDAARLAGVEEARGLLPRVIRGAQATGWIPNRTFDRVGVKNLPYDEPYVLPENLFLAHELTGESWYLDLAKLYLLDKEFFDPLARGENILPGRHGYSHIIALSSAAKAYEVLGDGKYLRALRNAWEFLETTQQFASGAWAPQEMFVEPHSGGLGRALTSTRDHFETPCCYYAHSKMARYLTSFTGEARYGDGLERVLLNTILGATDPDDDGGYFYYADYQAGARKRYYQRKWPCCAGTLLQSVADYPLNLYFHDDSGIYLNLYAGSEVRWRGVTLTQTTAYPESEEIAVRVGVGAPTEFAVHLRIPGWLERPARVLVNGKAVRVEAKPGRFATIRRRWRDGDRIDLTLPFTTRAVAVDDRNPDTVAVMRGPVMLVAVDAPSRLAAASSALLDLRGAGADFVIRGTDGEVRLRPFYRVKGEMYSTYFSRV